MVAGDNLDAVIGQFKVERVVPNALGMPAVRASALGTTRSTRPDVALHQIPSLKVRSTVHLALRRGNQRTLLPH